MLASQLDMLTVDSGVYFEFQIPENTFLDLQDGSTRNLSLNLLDSSKQVSNASTEWLVITKFVLLSIFWIIEDLGVILSQISIDNNIILL